MRNFCLLQKFLPRAAPRRARRGKMSVLSESVVARFLAERLHVLTCARNREHWLTRLDHLLTRPSTEGPRPDEFDGMNQAVERLLGFLLQVEVSEIVSA
jgi:hypothetical protein